MAILLFSLLYSNRLFTFWHMRYSNSERLGRDKRNVVSLWFYTVCYICLMWQKENKRMNKLVLIFCMNLFLKLKYLFFFFHKQILTFNWVASSERGNGMLTNISHKVRSLKTYINNLIKQQYFLRGKWILSINYQ